MGVGWGCGRGGSRCLCLDFRPYLVSTERKAWKLPTILILRPQGSSCFLRENKFPQVLSSSCCLQSEGTTPSPHLTSVLAPISPPTHLMLTLCPLPPFPLHGSEVRTWLRTGRDTWSHLVLHGKTVSVDAVLLGRWAHGLASPRWISS